MSGENVSDRLKKGDKVIIHTHRHAEIYKDQIFTCGDDEFEYDDERHVFLEDKGEFGKNFLVKFPKKV